MEEPRTYDGKKVVIWLGVVVVLGVGLLVFLLFAVRGDGAPRASPAVAAVGLAGGQVAPPVSGA